MTDIVGKLRLAAAHPYNQHGPQEFLTDAADEIERLRAALKDIRDHSLELYATGVARAALAEENNDDR